jgi:hypothetical protein
MAVESADAYTAMQTLLTRLDLPIGKGADGLGGRLWKHIVENGGDENALVLWLNNQPEFATRFPAMETLRKRNAAITPGDYIGLERSYRSSMRSVGIPESFFDKPNDFTKLIENDVNPEEFRGRLVEGYDKVAKTDPMVRQVFQNYFGVKGDAALASYFIDPEKSTPVLMRAARAAQIGTAAAKSVGSLNLNYASRLAEQGISYEQALQGFSKMSSMSSLFDAGINETVIGNQTKMDFAGNTPETSFTIDADTKAELAADFAFGVNSSNAKQLEERLAQRKAEFQGQTQRIGANKAGETNLGSAF